MASFFVWLISLFPSGLKATPFLPFPYSDHRPTVLLQRIGDRLTLFHHNTAENSPAMGFD